MSGKFSIKDGQGSDTEAKAGYTNVTKEQALWVNIAGNSPGGSVIVVPGAIPGSYEIDQKLSLNGAGSVKEMDVDGSITAQEFRLEADPDFDLQVVRILFSGLDGSVKTDKWFSANTALTTGCLLSLKQDNISLSYDEFKTAGDILEFATEGGASLENVSASVFVKGSHKYESPYILRKQGTHGIGSDDYISFLIQDDITFMESFRCIVTTIKIPPGVL